MNKQLIRYPDTNPQVILIGADFEMSGERALKVGPLWLSVEHRHPQLVSGPYRSWVFRLSIANRLSIKVRLG